MYIPPHFRNENEKELTAFITHHPMAMIASNGETVPDVTHLPFHLVQSGGKQFLESHFSAANPHAGTLSENAEVIVIFSGPNAYISPVHYEKPQNVPTWNFIAVHVHGKIHFHTEEDRSLEILRNTIGAHDPAWLENFNALDTSYLSAMIKGIRAFSVEITAFEGKYKLSQNRTGSERKNITDHLSLFPEGAPQQEISGYMSRNKKP
ncbi:MAG TPA: FMN-binding negative transcriptional regulator [Bacteroidia bacterium]|nr:FMN-binding negative transcriptional regulator [Bacteroidia bacterium]